MKKLFLIIPFFLIFFFFSPSAFASHCAKENSTCETASDCRDGTAGCSQFSCKDITIDGRREGGVCIGPAPVPAPPTELRVVGTGSDYFEVQWNNSEHVEYYEVFYGKTGEIPFGKRQTPNGQIRSSTTISGLAPEASYSLYAKACNSTGGCSVSSNQTQVTTLSSGGTCGREGTICGNPGDPSCCSEFRCGIAGDATTRRCTFFIGDNDNPLPEPPQNFKVVKVSDRTAEFVWDILPFAQRYELEYQTKNGNQKKIVNLPPAAIDGLEPKTEYGVSIKGCNRARCSPQSLTYVTTTEEKRSPLAPTSPTPIPPLPQCAEWVNEFGKLLSKEDAVKTGLKKCTKVNTGLGIPLSTDPVGFVKSIFGIILSLSGGIALLLIIFSGYKLMLSQGNPEKAQEAKETLTAAIVGLLFIIFSLVILQVIGVDILRIPGFDR